MKKIGLILLALCLVFPMVLFAGGEKEAEAETEEVAPEAAGEKVLKIGVIGPYTGSSARTGTELKNTAIFAFENIDYKIGDYTIELVFIDSQGDPAKAASAYSEAVEGEGVQATIFAWYSTVCLALLDLAAKYEIPNVGSMGGARSAVEKYSSDPKYRGFWTRGYPIVSRMTSGYVDFLEDAIASGEWNPEEKTVAVYGLDTDWGREVAGSLKKAFLDKGWDVITEDYLAMNQTDFYPLMGKYKNMDATVLAGSTSSPSVSTAFIKQAAEVGVEAVIIDDGLGWIGEFYDLTGSASNYIFDMIPQFSTEEAVEWGKAYEERFGYFPGATASGINWDNANLFIKILRRAYEKYGELNKETIHSVISDEVCTGQLTYGVEDGSLFQTKFEYSLETHNEPLLGPEYWYLPIIQYYEGDSKIVYPYAWAQAEPVFVAE